MTRRVLSSPPLRRGLAWGLAVLLGCAVLLGTRSGSDVVAKDEPAAKKTLPADLALIPGDSFAFVTVRVADLWNDEGTKGLRTDFAKLKPDEYKELIKSVAVPLGEVERLTFVITKTPGPNDAGPVMAILVATTKPYDKKKVLDELVPEAKEEKHKGKTYHVLGEAAVYPVDATTFLMGRTETVQGVMDAVGKGGDSVLAPALALAAGKHHVVGAMRPAALLETIGNMIPPEVEAFKPLLEAHAAYGSIDLGKEAKLEARLVCGGESEAKDAMTAAKGLIALIQTVLPMGEAQLEKLPKGKVDTFKKLYKDFGTAIKDVPIEVKGKQLSATLTLKADIPTISKGLFEGLMVARGAASEVSSANNIKQMVLAMHNYASAMDNTFPPAAITDKNDKPLLSWRVAILPYVEQDQLYQKFHLDEPWDSDHNKKLLENMPKIFQVPAADGMPPEKANTTHYRVFHGKGAAFEGTKGAKLPGDFGDGTSNTILIVEAEDAVPWTKPDELPFDPKKDPPKLGLKGAEKFNAGFADGAVHVLSKKIDKDVLKALITRNGGETVTIPDQ